MKIGIFTNNYLPNPYGVTGSVESFRRELERNGHEVFIFAPGWKGYADTNPRVFRYPSLDIRVKIRFPLAIPFSRRIDRTIEKLDLDIIHSQHPNLLGSAARKWAKKKNIPLVFTWHTLYDRYVHFVPFIPRRLAAWWIIRQASRYADRSAAVVVPTDSVKKIIQGWGVINPKIFPIPTGVEEGQFDSPDRTAIRRKFNIADDEIVLLSNARLTEEKNIEFVFRAAAEVLRRNRQLKLLVVDEGYLQPRLEAFCEKQQIAGRVIFTGKISREERKDYYSAADIFIFGSKSETQGTVTTEAMYLGLPIVALDAPGTRDLVEDGRNGFLVSEDEKVFAEKIGKLVQDEDLRRKFGEEGRKIAREKYTDRICAARMLELYRSLIR